MSAQLSLPMPKAKAARGMPAVSVMAKAEAVRAVDQRAIALLQERGQPFTVPAFCRAWLEIACASK